MRKGRRMGIVLGTILILLSALFIVGGYYYLSKQSKDSGDVIPSETPLGWIDNGDKWNIDLQYVPNNNEEEVEVAQKVYEYEITNELTANSVLVQLQSLPTLKNIKLGFLYSDAKLSDYNNLTGEEYRDFSVKKNSIKYVYLIITVEDSEKFATYKDQLSWIKTTTGLINHGDKWDIDIEYVPELEPENTTMVYEYELNNESTTNKSLISFQTNPSASNMEIIYTYSDTRITDYSKLSQQGYKDTITLNSGASKYMYLLIRVIKQYMQGSYTDTISLKQDLILNITYDYLYGFESTEILANTEIDQSSAPTLPTNIYTCTLDGWYTDEECINKFDFATSLTEDIVLYAKRTYTTTDWISYDATTKTYQVVKGTQTLPAELFLPKKYDDGVNGEAYVTLIVDGTNESPIFPASGITSLTIPNSITYIGQCSFSGCTTITELNFEANSQLETIGYYAFYQTSIQSLTIPASVTSFDGRAFSLCSNLEELYVEEGNEIYRDDGGNNIIQVAVNNIITDNELLPYLIRGNKNGVITNDIAGIGKHAFDGTTVKSINIHNNIKLIDYAAFSNCTSLTSVEVADDSQLEIIGDFSFAWSAITSIVIPNTVKSLDMFDNGRSFFSCSELESVKFEDGSTITKIPISTFYKCSKLKSINIPSSMETIDDMAFAYCSSLTELIIPEGVKYINYGGIAHSGIVSIVIPDSVISIGESVLQYCVDLSKVTISKNISAISNKAFYSCSKLTEVIFQEGSKLTHINSFAFALTGFTQFTIPEGVQVIKDGAFYKSSLESVTISSSVTSINGEAFDKCSSLTSAIFNNPYNWVYYSDGVVNVSSETLSDPSQAKSYLSKDLSKEAQYSDSWYEWNYTNSAYKVIRVGTASGDVVIKSTYDDGIHGEAEVVEIEAGVFQASINLTSITIPNTIKTIGTKAFYGCENLTTVTFEDGSLLESVAMYLFDNCSKLESIHIPSNVQNIEAYAFSGCVSLKTVTFASNETLTSIGAAAFDACSSLVEITIPSSLTSVGYSAFYNCEKLETINLPNQIQRIDTATFYNCKNLTNFTMPSSVTYIGQQAFYNCVKLTELNLPEGLLTIYSYAFQGCSGITSITIPSTVTTVRDRAFASMGLTSIVVPINMRYKKGGRYISAKQVFENCKNLASITIGKDVTTFGSSNFIGCSSLTSIVVDEDNTTFTSRDADGNECNAIIYISKGTLYGGCMATIIPSTVNTIGPNAFDGCTGLTSITIPSTVTSISSYAFSNCVNLVSVIFDGESQLESIGSYAFNGCTNLKNIAFPNTLTTIDSNAFYECTSLAEVVFNNESQLTTIGSYAFSNCTGITLIKIPSGVTSIASTAFEGCSNLESIIVDAGNTTYTSRDADGNECNAVIEISTNTLLIGCKNTTIIATITSIGNYAFCGCSGLQTIEIPTSVTSIGYSAFSGCTALTSVAFEDTTSKWEKVYSTSNSVPEEVDITNSSVNATNLTQPDYKWSKVITTE